MTVRRLCVLCHLGVLFAGIGYAQQQPPRFRSSVEVTSIDVGVVDAQGAPLLNLSPADFTVRVDGKSRTVVSAEWVPMTTMAAAAKPAPRVPEGYSSNENATGGRLIAIAVDEPHIRPGGAAAVLAAASAFIDRLSPSDRIAAISLGLGGTATPFIGDRDRVKAAISLMVGQRQTLRPLGVNVTPYEALEIADGNRLTGDQVAQRECTGLRPGTAPYLQCRQEVEAEAVQVADELKHANDLTLRALREVFTAIEPLDGPKTLILMSEGFSLRDTLAVNEIGALAAATRTSVYALKLDNQLFELTNARGPASTWPSNLGAEGLEILTGVARGTLFNVTGTGAQLFNHIESELAGYYLLGVESDPVDRDGRPHAIRIDVSRRGATVRTRRQLLNVSADLNRPKTARDAVNASITAPLLMSALPLRVVTFALKGPEQSKVQLLIRAEVGTDYVDPKPAVLGYVIMDAAGTSVEQRTFAAVLTPAMNGVPGALQYTGGASLAPGEYTIKMAVAEGNRVGSVEHAVHASLQTAGNLSVSELMVGGPTDSSDVLHPTIGYTVSYGTVHGYLEAYGSETERLGARYEVAATPDGPALLSADVRNRLSGGERALFTQMIPVAKLPAGEYVLRATLLSGARPLKTMTRRFEIAPPAVLMSAAAGAALAPRTTSAELFLPVDEGTLIRAFGKDDALRPQTLNTFLQRVPAATKPAFDQGVAELQKANYGAAADNFKKAIRPDVDSTAAMSYLAAVFAAAGHDAEAASAWQTALVDGSDLPQIYEWLGDTFVRTKDYTAARSILEEAAGRWPTDTRFGRGLALSYAISGRGRDAVRALDRYIADGHAEPDLLLLVVEWIFQVHNSHAVVVNPAADLALAKNYAAQYAKAGGTKQPLVNQWVGFLENEGKAAR